MNTNIKSKIVLDWHCLWMLLAMLSNRWFTECRCSRNVL